MTLRQKRCLFTELAARLIIEARRLGYECAMNEVLRSPAKAKENAAAGVGIVHSNHLVGLAVDLNLYLEGRYLTKSEDHLKLGLWWEKQHPLARWGGRWNDGNHYSLEHDGVR